MFMQSAKQIFLDPPEIHLDPLFLGVQTNSFWTPNNQPLHNQDPHLNIRTILYTLLKQLTIGADSEETTICGRHSNQYIQNRPINSFNDPLIFFRRRSIGPKDSAMYCGDKLLAKRAKKFFNPHLGGQRIIVIIIITDSTPYTLINMNVLLSVQRTGHQIKRTFCNGK